MLANYRFISHMSKTVSAPLLNHVCFSFLFFVINEDVFSVLGIAGKAHGVISTSGHFEGRIITPNETYFIEKTEHYFDEPVDYHSFIYRQSDVIFNTSQTTCARDRLKEKQKLFMIDQHGGGGGVKSMHIPGKDVTEDWRTKYLEGNDIIDDVIQWRGRRKRAIDPSKTTCELFMQVNLGEAINIHKLNLSLG